MRLRTRLILAFFLLSVLPLSGIVLFSYRSSQKALRQAAEAEAAVLAEEISERMETVRSDLHRRISGLAGLPLRALHIAGEGADPEVLGSILESLGEAMPLFSSLEFIPAEPGVLETGGPARVRVVIDAETDGDQYEAWVMETGRDEAAEGFLYRRGPKPELLARRLGAADDGKGWKPPRPPPPHRPSGMRPRRDEPFPPPRRMDEDPGVGVSQIEQILGRELGVWLKDGEEVVGRIQVEIDPRTVLRHVLRATRYDKGEIPFAIDGAGRLLAATEAHSEALEDLPEACLMAGESGESVQTVSDWVVVTNKDPASGVTLGIARPVGEPLREMQRAAMRNLGYGVGMIGFALLGILPLSNRMTRGLSRLSEGVEKLTEGDLGARVEVLSGDEIGVLAGRFNRMAEELSDKQVRLLEEERRHREQELRQEFLEAEHARKTQELEEARRFQLSLLPRGLPERDDLEIAVLMKTATEVGGDYYDFRESANGSLTLAVGDATGHGATAGTMVTAIKSLFMASGAELAPGDFLSAAAGAVQRMELGRMGMALALGRFEAKTLTLASAGMPPILIRRAASQEVEEIVVEALPLGRMAASYADRQIDLASGDTVLFMTDGLAELLSPAEDVLGYAAVREIFLGCADQGPQEILDCLDRAASEWREDRALEDDYTLVVVRVG